MTQTEAKPGGVSGAMVAAWLLTAVFYFYQYTLRSAPSVVLPQLGEAFGVSAAGLTSLLSFFYYGYALFSLIAGLLLDRLGPHYAVPGGAALVALGALLFATAHTVAAGIGCFFEGAGGAFSMIGAIYLITTYFPPSRGATLVGATQMFGMAGGAAGQFVVGPAVAAGLSWNLFWLVMAAVGFVIALLLFAFIPEEGAKGQAEGGWTRALGGIAEVFRNPQSLLCGVIAGLLFMPTSVFGMVWGVRFLQEAHSVPYGIAVLRSAALPLGWIIGCPLLGAVSDRLGRRKPVIIGGGGVLFACLAFILYGAPGTFPVYSLGLLAGVASGGAMLLYTVIKEVNARQLSGTATGVINFINFSMCAFLGPIFAGALLRASGAGPRELAHYQEAFAPIVWGVALAIVLTGVVLRETGPAARPATSPRAHDAGLGDRKSRPAAGI